VHLTSTANPLVKELRLLHRSRGRREQGRFLAEGRRLIDGLLTAGWRPCHLLLRDDLPVPPGWPDGVIRVEEAVCRRLSVASSPAGYFAVFPLPDPTVADPTTAALVLVAVADPGNLGTLLRTAAARGLPQVLLVGGADPFAPKSLSASAGAVAIPRLVRLPVGTRPEELAPRVPCIALVPTGGGPTTAIPAGPAWLCVGSEAHGLSADWLAACHHRLTLPMRPGVESINAAVAGSIALYQLDLAPREPPLEPAGGGRTLSL
jgi:TrmH family RNA methyltransferase